MDRAGASSVPALRPGEPGDDGAGDARRARRRRWSASRPSRPSPPPRRWPRLIVRRCSTASTAGWRAAAAWRARFGARFDMEIDALLILVLSRPRVAVRKGRRVGSALGPAALPLRRGGMVWPRGSHAPLPPSRRRQTICVVQIARADVAVVLPDRQPLAARSLAAAALAALASSFLVDIVWLWRRRPMQRVSRVSRRWRHLAWHLVLLDASLSFQNVWPTPAIGWRGELSVELAVCIAGLMALPARRFGPPSRRALAWLAAIWVAARRRPLRGRHHAGAVRPRHQPVLGRALHAGRRRHGRARGVVVARPGHPCGRDHHPVRAVPG